MKKKLLAMIITIPIIFSACTSGGKEIKIGKEEEFYMELKNINKSAEELSKNNVEFNEKYTNWFKKEEDISKEYSKELLKYRTYSNSENRVVTEENRYDELKVITVKEAKEDLEMLFKLFKHCYGAYGYFGGDETFLKAKADILRELEGKNEIRNWDFQELIYSKLNFIKDYHFRYEPELERRYYISRDREFYKNNTGYYKNVNNKPLYIEQINNDKDIKKFMKRTINKDGKIVYVIAVLDDSHKKNIEINVEYYNEKDRDSEKLNLSPLDGVTRNIKEDKNLPKSKVPLVRVEKMYKEYEEDNRQNEFIESGKVLKDSKVNIIDLRGAGGGYTKYAGEWFKNYTGEEWKCKSVDLELNSNLHNERRKTYNFEVDSDLFKIKPHYLGEYNRIKNKNIIFVLIDKLDVSASELFIENLREMDNVVLVGTNTGGCTLSLAIITYSLKNSKIPISLGGTFHMQPYFEGFEYKGFEPDILLDTSESLKGVQKLIEYYKLNSN